MSNRQKCTEFKVLCAICDLIFSSHFFMVVHGYLIFTHILRKCLHFELTFEQLIMYIFYVKILTGICSAILSWVNLLADSIAFKQNKTIVSSIIQPQLQYKKKKSCKYNACCKFSLSLLSFHDISSPYTSPRDIYFRIYSYNNARIKLELKESNLN